jgi:hypothetical protein
MPPPGGAARRWTAMRVGGPPGRYGESTTSRHTVGSAWPTAERVWETGNAKPSAAKPSPTAFTCGAPIDAFSQKSKQLTLAGSPCSLPCWCLWSASVLAVVAASER